MEPLTREQVRNKNKPNILQMGGGVGFQIIGTNNQII